MKKALYIILSAACVLLCACNHTAGQKQEAHEEHDHHEGEELELSDEQIKTVDIRFGTLSHISIGNTVKAAGILEVDARDEAAATTLASGVVTRLLVRSGDRVSKGSTIAYVEVPELIALQQDYLAAKEEELLSAQELARQEALAAEGAGVKKNLERARTDRQLASTKVSGLARQLSLYGISPSSVSRSHFVTEIAVKAPASGTVTDISCSIGSYVSSSLPLLKIIDTSALYCTLNIFEKDLGSVEPGKEVRLYLTNRPETSFQGKIESLGAMLDDTAKAVPVRVKLTSLPEGFAAPGMAVTAVISLGDKETPALPDGAIVASEGRSYVFAVEGRHEEEGRQMTLFRKVEVVPGIKRDGFTQVSFLTDEPKDTEYVVQNAFYLGSMTSDHGEHSH